MNYFLHYTLYPTLAKHKLIYLYLSSISVLLIGCFFWLYCIDARLRKKILFYDTQLLDIQKKEIEVLTKNTLIKKLQQQKADLLLHTNHAYQEMNTFWHQAGETLNTFAHTNQLIVDGITITKQMNKNTLKKRIFSLTLQGNLQGIIRFLEAAQKTKYLMLETFFLRVETKNTYKLDCSYAVQKIKTPSTINKLKG